MKKNKIVVCAIVIALVIICVAGIYLLKNQDTKNNTQNTSINNESKEVYEEFIVEPGISCEKSVYFDLEQFKGEYNSFTNSNDVDSMWWLSLGGISNENNKISFNLDNPTEWWPSIKDRFINENKILGLMYTTISDDMIDVDTEEVVEINGRDFVKIQLSINGRQATIVGYFTVYQNENTESYKEANTLGFFTFDISGKCDLEKMDEYARHSAETLELQ